MLALPAVGGDGEQQPVGIATTSSLMTPLGVVEGEC